MDALRTAAARVAEAVRTSSGRADELEQSVQRLGAQIAALVDAELGAFTPDGDQRAQLAARADAYRRLLAQIRPVGGEVATMAGTHKRAAALLSEVSGQFPTDWIDASNRSRTVLIAKNARSRAHYKPGQVMHVPTGDGPQLESEMKPEGWAPNPDDPFEAGATIYRDAAGDTFSRGGYVMWRVPVVLTRTTFAETMPRPAGAGWFPLPPHRLEAGQRSGWGRVRQEQRLQSYATLTADSQSVAAHEFSHRVEDMNPRIGVLTAAHVRRRTTTAGQRDACVRYARGEYVRPDKFADVYMGKEYKTTTFHEVLSCGSQALFHGDFGGFEGADGVQPDHESRDFVLGLYACA